MKVLCSDLKSEMGFLMCRDLSTYVGIVNRSESVTRVTAQNLHTATHAYCDVTRAARKNLRAAIFVTCPPV